MLAWAAASCMIALLLARKQKLGVTYAQQALLLALMIPLRHNWVR